MPRYFFDFFDGTQQPDKEGCELPSADVAKREARQTLAQILQEEVDFAQAFRLSTKVRDASGHVVLEATVTMDSHEAR